MKGKNRWGRPVTWLCSISNKNDCSTSFINMCVFSVTQSYLILYDLMDYSLPGSSVHGIFQGRILSELPFPSPRDLPDPEMEPTSLVSSALAGRFFTNWATRKALCLASVQFSSVQSLSHIQLCDPMDCSTSGFPVHHQLPELTQTHVHWASDAIQPSHPLLSPSPPAFNYSQHQGLFKLVSSSHRVARVLEFQLQHQSFQWIFRTDFL